MATESRNKRKVTVTVSNSYLTIDVNLSQNCTKLSLIEFTEGCTVIFLTLRTHSCNHIKQIIEFSGIIGQSWVETDLPTRLQTNSPEKQFYLQHLSFSKET